MEEIKVKLTDVCKEDFLITPMRYRQLANENVVPPVEKGYISYRAAVRALMKYRIRLAEGQGSLSLIDVRTRKEAARAEREEIIVKKRQGELVVKDASVTWLSRIITEAKSAFMNLAKRLAPELVGLAEKEIQVKLDRAVKEILWEL